MLSPKDLSTLQQFAETTAIKAGRFLLEHQQKASIVKHKADIQDIATTADLESEKIIIAEIKQHFPQHNILSEEIGLINHHSDYTWVIDPIDCTKEYFRGLPTFGVLLSCEHKNHTLAGCVHIPKINETYSASLGNGTFKDGSKIKVSSQLKLARAFIFTHIPNTNLNSPKFHQEWQKLGQVVSKSYRVRSNVFDAQSICWLASGAIDAFFLLDQVTKVRHWDIAASLIIAQEAGAKISDCRGNPLKFGDYSSGLVISNGRLHSQLLQILNS